MPGWSGLTLDHLWQSTGVAALAALLTLAFRRHRAPVRYWLWFAASVKFLVPFAALAALGARVNIWSTRDVPPPRPTAAFLLSVAAEPFTQARFSTLPASPGGFHAASWAPLITSAVVMVWMCGALFLLARWCLRWRRTEALLRRTTHNGVATRELAVLRRLEAVAGPRTPIALAATTDPIEPGVIGVVRPVLLWPTRIGDYMTDAELDAVLAHELCHVRRRDNLTASIHMVVEALFWFHPIVWWLGARLMAERERACDEDVLGLGHEPQLYAAAILKTCRLFLQTPLPCVAGITGSDLKRRIARVMSHTHGRPLTWPWRACLAAIALGALAAPVLAGALVPARVVGLGGPIFQAPRLLLAWAPRADVDPRLVERARFVKVSLTANATGRGPSALQTFAGGRVAATAVTARDLIRVAYARDARLADYQLVGADAWISRDRFDLRARAGHDFVNDRTGEPHELIAMLRNLLADRFALALHRETRVMPVYALVRVRADALGPGLRPSTSTCWRAGEQPVPAVPIPVRQWCKTGIRGGPSEAVSMAWLAMVLSARRGADRPVEDGTGLAGAYDLGFTPPLAEESPAADLEEQLGLRLEPRQGPVDVLVLDHIERPATN